MQKRQPATGYSEMGSDRAAASPAPPLSVAVCICTYRRPDMLIALLLRLRSEAAAISDDVRVGIVVVDDDAEKSAELPVKGADTGFDLGVRYIHAGGQNIAIARNLALNAGVDMAGLVALIDDDCVPAEGWLSELLRVFSLGAAEIVTGVCRDQFPESYPSWVHRGPYFDPPLDEPDGALVTTGYIKNILISADALRRTGIQFDPDFGRTGGEDEMFLIQARRLGFRNRRAARAIVYEQVPVSRLTFKYQLKRRLWYGNTESLTTVAAGTASRPRALLRGARLVTNALFLVPIRLIRRQPMELHSAAAALLQGLGRIMGAVGIPVNHR